MSHSSHSQDSHELPGPVARRQWLQTAGVATASAMWLSATARGAEGDGGKAQLPGYDAAKGEYVLPPLDYDTKALEPSIDAQTMTLHHDKHHLAYVTGLNTAMAKLADARKAGDYALIKHWSREAAFHGSGHFLHCIFWKNMAPAGHGGGGEPSGDVAAALTKNFGSVDDFRKQFSAAAIAVEGSGWALLCHEPVSGHLEVLQAEKHQNLTQWGVIPLLVLDVWEHAYYLKYQNRRPDYVKAFWDVVNWSDVAQRMHWH